MLDQSVVFGAASSKPGMAQLPASQVKTRNKSFFSILARIGTTRHQLPFLVNQRARESGGGKLYL